MISERKKEKNVSLSSLIRSKPKPIGELLLLFLIGLLLFVYIVIVESNYLGFGFTTLISKTLLVTRKVELKSDFDDHFFAFEVLYIYTAVSRLYRRFIYFKISPSVLTRHSLASSNRKYRRWFYKTVICDHL